MKRTIVIYVNQFSVNGDATHPFIIVKLTSKIASYQKQGWDHFLKSWSFGNQGPEPLCSRWNLNLCFQIAYLKPLIQWFSIQRLMLRSLVLLKWLLKSEPSRWKATFCKCGDLHLNSRSKWRSLSSIGSYLLKWGDCIALLKIGSECLQKSYKCSKLFSILARAVLRLFYSFQKVSSY